MARTLADQVAANTKRLTTKDYGRKSAVVRVCGQELTATGATGAGAAVAYLALDPEMTYISQMRFKIIIGDPLAPGQGAAIFNPTGNWDLSPNHQTGKYASVQEFYEKHIFMGVNMDGEYGYQCPVAGTMVTMNDGRYVPVELLKEKDIVKGGNKVITNDPRLSEIIKISTSVGEFKVSPDHRLELYNGAVVKAKTLRKGEVLSTDAETINKPIYDLTDDELRFFGFWLGDGTKKYRWTNSKTPEVFVTVGVERKENYLNKLDLTLTKRTHSNRKASIYYLKNSDHITLVKLIHSLHDKELPQWFTAEQYKLIIEGYLEADGSKHRRGYVAASTNKELLVGMQFACAVNNIYARLSGPQHRKKTNLCDHPKDIYRLYVYPERDFIAEVQSVTRDKDDYVYIINLNGDHLYWADNYHFHNCWDLADDFWVNQVGRKLETNGGDDANYSRGVQNSWLVTGNINSGNGADFAPITEWKNIHVGDWIFWKGANGIGHVAMALRPATSDTSGVMCISQNYREPNEVTGSRASQDMLFPAMGSLQFLGAFRWRGDWNTSAPVLYEDQRLT